jgi:hypothetical protein
VAPPPVFARSCQLFLAVSGGRRPFFVVADSPYKPTTKKYFKRNHFSFAENIFQQKTFYVETNGTQISMLHESNK